MRKELRFTLRGAPALALFGLTLGLPGAAAAAPDKPASTGATVLLLEGVTPIPSLKQELVASAADAGQLVQASGLGLEDLQIAVGCADRSVACLQQIGNSIKAGAILLVSAHGKPTADQAGVTMRLFVVRSGADRARSTVMLPLDAVARRAVLARALGRVFGAPPTKRAKRRPVGTLEISTTQSFVELEIDGQPRGTPPLALRNLPAGRYKLVARLRGHLPFQSTAVVQAGRTTRVRIDLVPAQSRTGAAGFLDSIRTPTWIVLGAGFVSLGAGAIFGAHMLAQQNDFDANAGNTLEDLREMNSLADTGDRDAVIANVLFGVGGVALIGAAVMAYIDYSEATGAGERRRPSAASVAVGPGSVGLHLSF